MRKVRNLYGLLLGLMFAAYAQGTTVEAVRGRFPELNVPQGAVMREVSGGRAELQAAVDAALATAGDDLLILKGSGWTGVEPITVSAGQGGLWIVGDLDEPPVLEGFGLLISDGTVGLANVSIRGAVASTALRCSGLLISGGTVTVSAVSVVACDGGALGYAGGIAVRAAVAALYNVTVADCRGGFAIGGAKAAVRNISGTLSLTHCTVAGYEGEAVAGTVAQVNNWFNPSTVTVVETVGRVLHCPPEASSAAVDAGVKSILLVDALGAPRVFGSAADLGAVEVQEVVVEPPTDFVALPSGMRQIYLGWSDVPRGERFRLEEWVNGAWEEISEAALDWTPVSGNQASVAGWRSVRHHGLEPGSEHRYRLVFNVAGQEEPVRTDGSHSAATLGLECIPQFASRPGAAQTLYLDFAGYVFDDVGNMANARMQDAFAGCTYVRTAPFSYEGWLDGAQLPTTSAIRDIWRMVAEDFALFDVNVTTVEPPIEDLRKTSEADTRYGVRVVIGYGLTPEGTRGVWFEGGGGVSQWGTYDAAADIPAFVFSEASRQGISAQATHEIGHTLGLHHDGGNILWGDLFLGEQEYYTGQEITPNGVLIEDNVAVTETVWYPIMGGVPSATRNNGVLYDSGDFMNQWCRGGYSGAFDAYSKLHDNVPEDDFAVMLGLWAGKTYARGLDYRDYGLRLVADDHADTLAEATPLAFVSQAATASGVIGKHVEGETVLADRDCFAFSVDGSGMLTVLVSPGYLGEREGSSLDAQVELLDALGVTIAVSSLPLSETAQNSPAFRDAELRVVLPAAGRYVLRVSGTAHSVSSADIRPDGEEETPWQFNDVTAYGSVGPYSLRATLSGCAPCVGMPGLRVLLK